MRSGLGGVLVVISTAEAGGDWEVWDTHPWDCSYSDIVIGLVGIFKDIILAELG